MNWKLTVACIACVAAPVVACLDVTPTAPSPAFESMVAAANDADGGEDAGVAADGGDARADDGAPGDSSAE